MPIYEYRCPNGHLLEVFHGMNDPSPERCEVCGASPLERAQVEPDGTELKEKIRAAIK